MEKKCRCGHDHTGQEEVNEEKIIAKLSQEIADEIDQEIFEEIMAKIDPYVIPPLLKERK